MLRALFVIAIIAYGCAKSAKGPFYALLFYLWIAYFRPQSWLWWDFFTQLNLSFIIGTFVVLTALLAPSEKLRFGAGPFLIVLFLTQTFIATIASPNSDYAWIYFSDFAKAATISLLMVSLVKDESRLRLVFAVIAFSLGLEGVKQGWAQLVLNPGGQNSNEYPVLGDNNGVAVGMLMLTSILTALARTSTAKWQRLLTRFAIVGVIYRAISTYSRGGFLSCAVLAFHYQLRSRRKLVGAFAILALCALIVPVLPDAFWDRMGTIRQAQEDVEDADASVRGRLHFWRIGWLMARDRPMVGVGHNAYNAAYPRYDFSEEFTGNRSVHSAWVGVLAENGFPGLILFALLVVRSLWICARTQRLAKKHPELETLGKYANGIEGALLVFCVGGAFVIFQYHEILWHSLALSMAIERMARERLAGVQSATPQTRVAPVAAGQWVPPGRVAMSQPMPLNAQRPVAGSVSRTGG
jgi:probable O-glycosylation ligase (exosortase A-associated)